MSTQPIPARAARLHQLWQQLPAGTLTEVQIEERIVKLLDRPAAQADASAYMALLVGAQAVTATRTADGTVVYRKSETFPEWPENGPGTPAWDRQIKEMAAREAAENDRAAAGVQARAPQNLQRAELDAHVRSVMREVLRTEVPPMVRALLHQVEQQAEARRRVRGHFDKQTQEDPARAGVHPDRPA